MSKSVRRKSFLTEIDMTGLLPESDFQLLENEEQEEVKVTEEDFEEMPSVMVMDDDYFQTDDQEKAKAQIQTLAEKTQKVAQNLPLHGFISNQTVHAELRWEKTKNWRPYASIKESEQISVLVEGVGKILVQCEYISQSEIKQHVNQDQMEQLEIIEAGLRRDSLNSTPRQSKIFNIPGL